MSQFNLLDEKWIPVKFPNGTRDELGLSDVLLRSDEIAVIEDPSPLVMAALHRLLLAVLYRALAGPTDIDQARARFRVGLPEGPVAAYLERWRDRFWLFDDKHPFFQVPDYEPKKVKGEQQWKSWPTIAAEHNADNSKVLFDHVDITGAGSVSSSRVARWLIACQSFALGGGKSDFQYSRSAPSATAVMVMPLGATLQDTLIMSLVPENRDVLQSDRPVWEREPDALASLQRGDERAITGNVDLYTWRSRSIKLRANGDGRTVDGLAFASGVECSSKDFIDPMLAYRIDEKRGKLPVQFRDRGLWRDFDSLLPDDSRLAPRVIEHAAALSRSTRERLPRSVIVLGQANKKAKIEYWRNERFALPSALAGDRSIRREIKQLLTDAESTNTALWTACASFASDLLSRGERDPAKKDVRAFVEQMAVMSRYWSTLESRFPGVLTEYSLDSDSEVIRREWLTSVRGALGTTWNQFRASVSTGDAWTIRAITKADRPVSRQLRKLNDQISELTPEEQRA